MACGYGINAKSSELKAATLDKGHVADLIEEANKHRRLLGMKKEGSLQDTLPLPCRMRHAVHVRRCLEQWQQPPTPPVPGQPQRGGRRGGPRTLTCTPPFTLTPMPGPAPSPAPSPGPSPAPSPAQPSPAQPSPAQPSPAQPSPAQPSPAQPSPAQPSPAQPSPAQPSPAQPSPAQPILCQPSPAPSPTPSPAQPSPAQPILCRSVALHLSNHPTQQPPYGSSQQRTKANRANLARGHAAVAATTAAAAAAAAAAATAAASTATAAIEAEGARSAAALQVCEAELEEARSQLRSCQSVNMRTATDLQECREQLHQSQQALQQSESEVLALQVSLHRCRAELLAAKQELAACKSKVRSMGTQLAITQAQQAAARKDMPKDVRDKMSWLHRTRVSLNTLKRWHGMRGAPPCTQAANPAAAFKAPPPPRHKERDTLTGAYTAAYACSNAALLTLPDVSCQQLGPLRTAVAAAEFPDAPPQPQAGPSTVRRHQQMLTRKIQGTFKRPDSMGFSIERLCSLIMGHWDGLPNMGGWSKPSFPTLTRWGSFVTACLSLTRVLGPVTKAVAIIMEERGALAYSLTMRRSGCRLRIETHQCVEDSLGYTECLSSALLNVYMMRYLGVNLAYILWADITMHASSTLDLPNDAVMTHTQVCVLCCDGRNREFET
ncbi:hypothetical protein QJQ45_000465 [Haematococcus lacustris]|nr:hypothetical protein QJQ45_000465 [Haematococcus lacustris]